MWALDGGDQGPGRWARHVHDLRQDWRVAFGEEIDRIDGVAIMTDADDSDSTARGRYGAIRVCGPASCEAVDAPESWSDRVASSVVKTGPCS